MNGLLGDRGYVLVEDLIGPGQVAFARSAMELSDRSGAMRANSGAASGAGSEQYAPVASELLLRHCQPKIETISGHALLPAYSFWRIYGTGSTLAPHMDREACEISATLMIHAEPAGQDWPIWLRDLQGRDAALTLRPGSAVVYQGRRVRHWREAYAGQRHFQIFLHYVRQDGEFAGFAHDGEPGLPG